VLEGNPLHPAMWWRQRLLAAPDASKDSMALVARFGLPGKPLRIASLYARGAQSGIGKIYLRL